MNDIEEKMKPIEKQYLHSMSIEELNAYRIVKNLAKPTFIQHVSIDEDDLEFITTLAEGITFEFKALYCFDINSKTIETALLRYLEICVLCNNANLYCISGNEI